ncbi:MAG: S9 family peptidase [Saprospiraceae bacterium]
MRKYILSTLVFYIFVHFATAQKEIKLEEIWKNGTFSVAANRGFNFLKDGVHYSKLEKVNGSQGIRSYNISTGNVDAELLDGRYVAFKKKIEAYSFSEDESKILLSTEVEQIYRHSTRCKYFVFDVKENKSSELYSKAQQYATFNAGADKVAFVCENNLYYKDLNSGKVTTISSDGKLNQIINGATDWVYEEEFAISKGFEWSPDGKKIAYLRFDESAVPEFRLDYYNNGVYPEPYTYRYPKVGQPNSTVSVFIYDTETGKNTKVSKDEGPDDYYPRIKWTQDANKLCMMHMNRLQNEMTLLIADAKSGAIYPMYKEVNARYIDIPTTLIFLKDNKQFLLSSMQDGFNNIYLHDMSGRPIRNITSCKCDITDFYGIDESKGELFYQAAEKTPMDREIYKIDLKGENKMMLSSQNGANSAEFSSTFDYFVLETSTINRAPTYTVFNRKAEKVRQLESNAGIEKIQQEKGCASVNFFEFSTADNTKLNGWILKPEKLKKKKKYPVLMYVYGGPGSQQVLNRWKGADYWWFQMMAQKGYIIACVDNRGTGARGEDFKKVTYKQLGKYETADQIEAAKYLGSLPNVDPKRIGIFGWSYGGFMASSCLFKGADVFKCAIAVAPVTNWKWYDNIYTERYMQTEKENAKGYEENSPINFADKMKGNLLLMHGTADDNVHFQNSVELSNSLIAANKQFDTYYYPNQNHGIRAGNGRLHLYTKMTNFLLEKL